MEIRRFLQVFKPEPLSKSVCETIFTLHANVCVMNADKSQQLGISGHTDRDPSPAGGGDSTDCTDRRRDAPARASSLAFLHILGVMAATKGHDIFAIHDPIDWSGVFDQGGSYALSEMPEAVQAKGAVICAGSADLSSLAREETWLRAMVFTIPPINIIG